MTVYAMIYHLDSFSEKKNRGSLNLVLKRIGQHFFSFRVIQQWNDLPQEVVLAKTISSFKYLLDKYWKETGHGHCQRPSAYQLTLYFLLSII